MYNLLFQGQTQISLYDNDKLTILVTDDAMKSLPIISGKQNKGVTHTITLQYEEDECSQSTTVVLEVAPVARIEKEAGCSWSKKSTHSHEFEIILQVSYTSNRHPLKHISEISSTI